MSTIDWFRRVILGIDPDDEGLGGSDNFGGEDDDEKISVFDGTKQFYTEDNDYPYAENYASAPSKKSKNEADTTKSQNKEVQSGNIIPVTKRSNLNISLITPRRFEGDEVHRAIQTFRDEGHTIILNLEDCEEEQSFVSLAIGLAGGINGHTDNISQSVYVLVPKNVELPGNSKDVENRAAQVPHSKSVW